MTLYGLFRGCAGQLIASGSMGVRGHLSSLLHKEGARLSSSGGSAESGGGGIERLCLKMGKFRQSILWALKGLRLECQPIISSWPNWLMSWLVKRGTACSESPSLVSSPS
jgi:hypothetical protein